ncbi:MAG TPA: aminoacyl-tRNA deacylase [Candidatus Hypogeohydataceae bacterium YC41]
MTVARNLKEFLDKSKVPYKLSTHQEVYTAQEVAHSLHVKGQYLAKVVMIKSKDKLVMTVLPASHKVNIEKIKTLLKDPETRLATEAEFKTAFPDCDVGAMPPIGHLYGLELYADKALTQDPEIIFQAGSHVETIRMKYSDWEKLAKPKIAEFAGHL